MTQQTLVWRLIFLGDGFVWLCAVYGWLGAHARRQHDAMPPWLAAVCAIHAVVQFLSNAAWLVQRFQ